MILNVQNVSKSFGKEKVLNNLSFHMDKPQITALIGPNGSGKTTLLNVITGLVNSESGDIKILNFNHKNPEIFKEISFMQDSSVLYDYLTGYDHLQFIGDIQGLTQKKIFSAAEHVGMKGYLYKKVSKYSLGMKQHLLLTMAILNRPRLLIMDEPLNGLDPTSAVRVRNILLGLHTDGTAILLSSHNLSEIDRLTSNVLFLKNGHLIAEDLSSYERIFYEITVDKPAEGKSNLEAIDVIIKKIEKNKLTVFDNGIYIQDILQKLFNNKIAILDVSKKVMGTEERYQEVFDEKEIRR